MSKRGAAGRRMAEVAAGDAGGIAPALAGPWAGRMQWLAMGVLGLLAGVAHFPGLRGEYIWDDRQWFFGVPYITEPGQFWKLWVPPGGTPHFFPLVTTGFWLEYRLWGGAPLGYHVTNLLLHIVAAVLVYQVVRRLKLAGGEIGAWLAAAIFAVHPVTVESVAWVAERKNVLCAAFFFGSALFGLRYLGLLPEEPGGRRRDWWVSLGLFVATMLSKSTGFFLPPAMLVMLWWRNGRVTRGDVVRTLPWFVISLALCGMGVYFEMMEAGTRGAAFQFSLLQRVVIAGNAFWFYLGKIVWPFPVMQVYPRFEIHAGKPITDAALYVAPVAFFVLLGVLAGTTRKIGRGPLAAVLIFTGGLFPALGFISFFTMLFTFTADHYQYLVLPVMVVFFVELLLGAIRWAGPRLAAQEAKGRRTDAGRMVRLLTGTVAVGIVVILGTLSFGVSSLYQSGLSLFGYAAALNPHAPALTLYAQAILNQPQPDYESAQNVLMKAIQADPDEPRPYRVLSTMYMRLHNLERAAYFQAEAEKRSLPGENESWNRYFGNMASEVQARPPEREELKAGRELERAGKWDEAMASYRQVLAKNPEDVGAELRIAFCVRVGKRDADGALAMVDAILKRHPESASAWFYRGWLLRSVGDEKTAFRAFEKAQSLDPKAAYENADLLYTKIEAAGSPASETHPGSK